MITDTAPIQPAPQDPGPLAFAMRESGQTCANGHAGIFEIAGTDAAGREYLGTWRYWCPTCRALTLTRPEALAALKGLNKQAVDGQRPIGCVVQASLPLTLELGNA